MIKEADQTARFLWAWLFNRTVTWTDTETQAEVVEHWDRTEFWHVFQPGWFGTFATTNPGCGCRKRLGVWPTRWCTGHAFPDWEDES